MNIPELIERMPTPILDTLIAMGIDVHKSAQSWQALHDSGDLMDIIRYARSDESASFLIYRRLASIVERNWIASLTRDQVDAIERSIGSLPDSSIELCPGCSIPASMVRGMWENCHG